MTKNIHFQLFLDKFREREYIRLPFDVEKDTESITIQYRYPSSPLREEGPFTVAGEPFLNSDKLQKHIRLLFSKAPWQQCGFCLL